MIDIDSDGVIGTKEYRFNCITRVAVDNIQTVDDAFDKLLDVSTICICVFFYLILGSFFSVCDFFCAFLFHCCVTICLMYFYFLIVSTNAKKTNCNCRMKIDDEVA